MKMLLAALVVVVALSSSARAEEWTRLDTTLQTTFLVSLAVDYVQTKRIIDDPISAGHVEMNPIIGHRGERVPPEAYFAVIAIGHTAAARALPQPWRAIAQIGGLTVQSVAIGRNWRVGYTLSF